VNVEHVNRKDERYTLYEGRTKSGKPKYYCSRKPSASGVPCQAMPPGYEWRENPEDGIVSVRKIRPSRITPLEREMLADGIRALAGLKTFIVEIDGDSLVAYIPDRNPEVVGYILHSIVGLGQAELMGEWTAKHAHYSPLMRFNLTDEDKRLFSVQRWCCRGLTDRWIHLDKPAPLAAQIDKYARHLGHESFYDLM
jgi:hypothetical protein